MLTEEKIKKDIIKANRSRASFLTVHAGQLRKILFDDEEIKRITDGGGVLVATNMRVIAMYPRFFNCEYIDFTYSAIISIQIKEGFLGAASIYISTAGNPIEIADVYTPDARKFVEFVRTKISGLESERNKKTPVSNNEDDTISKLERLANLKERGMLTDEEFAQQKAKILG